MQHKNCMSKTQVIISLNIKLIWMSITVGWPNLDTILKPDSEVKMKTEGNNYERNKARLEITVRDKTEKRLSNSSKVNVLWWKDKHIPVQAWEIQGSCNHYTVSMPPINLKDHKYFHLHHHLLPLLVINMLKVASVHKERVLSN